MLQVLAMEPGLAWAKEVDLRVLNNEAVELEKVNPGEQRNVLQDGTVKECIITNDGISCPSV